MSDAEKNPLNALIINKLFYLLNMSTLKNEASKFTNVISSWTCYFHFISLTELSHTIQYNKNVTKHALNLLVLFKKAKQYVFKFSKRDSASYSSLVLCLPFPNVKQKPDASGYGHWAVTGPVIFSGLTHWDWFGWFSVENMSRVTLWISNMLSFRMLFDIKWLNLNLWTHFNIKCSETDCLQAAFKTSFKTHLVQCQSSKVISPSSSLK